jgi:Prokaryotic E2 family E
MRRQFQLSSDDTEFLEGRAKPWETIVDAGHQWVLAHEFALPVGYNVSTAIAAVRLIAGYPDSALDMVYFHPHLARADAKGINALSPMQLDQKSFQQWSRHRPGGNPWRPGEDCLATHYAYIEACLADELRKR